VDLSEAMRFVPYLCKVQPSLPHGAVALSHDLMQWSWPTADLCQRRLATYFVEKLDVQIIFCIYGLRDAC
jgi:hypothetical protein